MNLPPALRALFSQIAALLLVAAIVDPLLERLGGNFSLFALALIQGGFAALFSLDQERWWIPIQLCFVPLIVVASLPGISPYWFLAGFILLGIVFWNVVKTRVPLFLTGRQVGMELARRLPEGKFEFADLGSGMSGLIVMLAAKKPDGNFFGVEIAPLPCLIGKLRSASLPNCTMKWGTFEKVELSRFDFVYAFLSPVPMPSLWEKARREMKPGSVFISNTFQVPGMEADETVKIGRETLYIWNM